MEIPIKALPGSGRPSLGHKVVQRPPSRSLRTEDISFSFILRHGTPPNAAGKSRKEFLDSLAPSDKAVKLVRAFARQHDLEVTAVDLKARKITLTGQPSVIARALHIRLNEYETPEGSRYLSHEEELTLPEALHEEVLGILGLHRLPFVKRPSPPPQLRVTPRSAETETVFDHVPPTLARLYDFPTGVDGSGQRIAIPQLGGGYIRKDIDTYFNSLGIEPPTIKDISVNGGVNKPDKQDAGFTEEVYADIYMAGTIAPKAELLVYFAPDNHLHALVETFQAIVYDHENMPGIISCSYGSAEKTWNDNDIRILESVLSDARHQRMTVFAASGDGGSHDDALGINVDYPASSPSVTGCGGTVAYVNPEYTEVLNEVVWNKQGGSPGATGGGISARIELPDWQRQANVPVLKGTPSFQGRGVPDIATVAGFFQIHMFGEDTKTGGTSCGAPLLAGLMACINQMAGEELGFINEALYKLKLGDNCPICHDIMEGNNGAYHAGEGWNPCCGLGRPSGKSLADSLIAELKGSS